MKEFQYTIQDVLGIHARPAGMLAKEAKRFGSVVTVGCGEKCANTAQMMKLMALGVKQGQTITVQAQGEDEDAAIAAMQELIERIL